MTTAAPSGDERDGGCACGHVRYRLASAPMYVHACHCTWCQRETGSAFAVNALIETDRVALLAGEVEWVDTPTNSGKGQRVARCPRCRVAVFSHYAYGPIGDDVRFVRVGTLDDPSRTPPDLHIFTSTKVAWLALPEGAPAVAEFYKASERWPAASLERRTALFAAAEAAAAR